MNPNAIKEWIRVRTDLEFGDINIILVTRIYDLIDILIKEYNTTATRYEEIVKEALQGIQKGKLHYEIKHGFKPDTSRPRMFVSRVRVYDPLLNKNIPRAVIKGEVKEPTNESRLVFCSSNSEGVCGLEIFVDKVGYYTVMCKIYGDGYESKSFRMSFETR